MAFSIADRMSEDAGAGERSVRPADRHEDRGDRPSDHHQWVPGYWHRRGHQYVWERGHWMDRLAVAPSAPPALLDEQQDEAPQGGDHFWAPGYWRWTGSQWHWAPGHWSPRYEGYVWARPYWVRGASGWTQGAWGWDHSVPGRTRDDWSRREWGTRDRWDWDRRNRNEWSQPYGSGHGHDWNAAAHDGHPSQGGEHAPGGPGNHQSAGGAPQQDPQPGPAVRPQAVGGAEVSASKPNVAAVGGPHPQKPIAVSPSQNKSKGA